MTATASIFVHSHVQKVSPSNIEDNLSPYHEVRFGEQQSSDGCDTTIYVGRREFMINKLAFTTMGEVFAGIFHGPFQENQGHPTTAKYYPTCSSK